MTTKSLRQISRQLHNAFETAEDNGLDEAVITLSEDGNQFRLFKDPYEPDIWHFTDDKAFYQVGQMVDICQFIQNYRPVDASSLPEPEDYFD